MAEPSAVITSSVSAISGALTLDYILASSAPHNFSDFNYKITNHNLQKITLESVFPNSGSSFRIPTSSFDMIVNDEAVKGSIHNIINTKKYERVMEQEFGVNMAGAVFQLFDDDMIDYVHMELTKSFSKYDGRLTVSSVQIAKSQDGKEIQIYCEVGIKGIQKSVPVIFRNTQGVF
jgi:phage baseplate assembly protein W